MFRQVSYGYSQASIELLLNYLQYFFGKLVLHLQVWSWRKVRIIGPFWFVFSPKILALGLSQATHRLYGFTAQPNSLPLWSAKYHTLFAVYLYV